MSTLTPTSISAVRMSVRATARLHGRREKERERRRFKLNALAARTATYFLNYGTDDRVTRQSTSDRQQDVGWLQIRTWHERS